MFHQAYNAALSPNGPSRPVPMTFDEAWAVHCDTSFEEAVYNFSNWGSKLSYLWTARHYQNPFFQKIYTERLFLRRAEELRVTFQRYASAAGRSIIQRFLLTRIDEHGYITIKILSFGCGPGCDAVSLMYVLSTLARDRCSAAGLKRIRFQITLVDREPGWKRRAVAAINACRSSDIELALTPLFIQGSWDDPRVLDAAVNADIMSNSHVVLDAAQKRTGEAAAAHRFFSSVIQMWKSQAACVRSSADYPCPKLLIVADRDQPNYPFFQPEKYDRIPVLDTHRRWEARHEDTKTYMGVIDVNLRRAAPTAKPAGTAGNSTDDQLCDQLAALTMK